MASIDPAIQSRLIRDLEPTVAAELDRHFAIAKDWYPHEYVPWSEGRNFPGVMEGEAWDPKDSKLTNIAADSLVLNLLTEDNLPSYHTEIALSMGRDGAWNTWINRWTAEEARHSVVLRDYLTVTRGVDPVALENWRMEHMQVGYTTPYDNDMLHTVAYVSFQELATRISHRNTGRISNDPICENMLARVALDENLHMLFYRNLLGAALKLEPEATLEAIADVLENFAMPGHGIPGFARKSVQIALAGIYDLDLHLNEVVTPVLRAWGVFEMTGLTGAAEAHRARIATIIERTSSEAVRFTEKREAHFDRLTTRGIEFVRLS